MILLSVLIFLCHLASLNDLLTAGVVENLGLCRDQVRIILRMYYHRKVPHEVCDDSYVFWVAARPVSEPGLSCIVFLTGKSNLEGM